MMIGFPMLDHGETIWHTPHGSGSTIKLSATPEATALHLNHDMLPASWQKGWSEGMSSRFKK